MPSNVPRIVRVVCAVSTLASPFGLAACAPGPADRTEHTADLGHISRGVIVSVRNAQPRADMQNRILVAINSATNSPDPVNGVEFIVRQNDGRTLSVVQSNPENLQPGDQVTLSRGARTRIARLPPGS
jgi:outer membrane lipoprotein SlyB